jgi:hypothetical protein
MGAVTRWEWLTAEQRASLGNVIDILESQPSHNSAGRLAEGDGLEVIRGIEIRDDTKIASICAHDVDKPSFHAKYVAGSTPVIVHGVADHPSWERARDRWSSQQEIVRWYDRPFFSRARVLAQF